MAKHQNQPTSIWFQMLSSFEIELAYLFESIIIQYIKIVNPIKNKKDLETTIDELRKFAYAYIEKYSPSKQQLRIYLFKKFLNTNQKTSYKKELFNLIDVVISTLVEQKFLSDKYYSDVKTKALLRRGYSLNKIRYNLIKKGIDEKYIKASISKIKENESDPDFFSAIKICKKRRIQKIL